MNIIQELSLIIANRKTALADHPRNSELKGVISGLENALELIEDGCEWEWSFAGDCWETECEHETQKFSEIEELPEFCPFCGRKVRLLQ